MKAFNKVFIIVLLVVIITFGFAKPIAIQAAATAPNLGDATNFSVLAGLSMSATVPAPGTHISGNLGLSPGLVVSRTGNWTVGGAEYFDVGGLSASAQADALIAFNNLRDQVPSSGALGAWGGATSLAPGIWTEASDTTFTGTLTLNGGYDDVWVFQIGRDMTFDGSVVLTGNAQPCHVFWQVGRSATIASGSTFVGTLIASTSITLVSGATVDGRMIALNGSLTTDQNTITGPTCNVAPAPPALDPILHLRKIVNNDNGGLSATGDFTLTANGTGANDISGTSPVDSGALLADTFALSETGPSGYTASAWVCDGGTLVGSNLTLVDGDYVTCTITNNDNTPSLTLVKTLVKDNGGVAVESDFTLTATGPTGFSGIGPTVNNGVSFDAGTYDLSETGPVGYLPSAWVCVGGTQVDGDTVSLTLGHSATCTIINNDIAPAAGILHIMKHVTNDNGGSALASAFTVNVTGTNVSDDSFTGVEDPGTTITLDAGAYTIDEGAHVGYDKTLSADCSGSILAGATKYCTITNNDITPQLIITKTVIGSTKDRASFSFFIDGTPATLDVVNDLAVGVHTVSETPDSNYTTVIGGNCTTNGKVTLALGDLKTCTITNTYVSRGPSSSYVPYVPPVPPLIEVLKVPSPLSLPNGAGLVKYTYTLKNIGTVPVSNITMVGDTCSPIVLISGDTNNDAKLDVTETWVHTCSTTLTETHTNVVTATGQANGITATDIASATVVVGVPIIPPLIHVVKVPNVFIAPVGGGVTYTYTVTNPGTEPLSNVGITDDKCTGLPDRVVGHPGDLNKNNLLESNETWIFTCKTNLTQTTTNTGTAQGSANGLIARDFSIATVVVADIVLAKIIPALPATGVATDSSNSWNIVISTVILTGLFSLYLIRRKGII